MIIWDLVDEYMSKTPYESPQTLHARSRWSEHPANFCWRSSRWSRGKKKLMVKSSEKTKMVMENPPFEDVFSYWTWGIFQIAMLVFVSIGCWRAWYIVISYYWSLVDYEKPQNFILRSWRVCLVPVSCVVFCIFSTCLSQSDQGLCWTKDTVTVTSCKKDFRIELPPQALSTLETFPNYLPRFVEAIMSLQDGKVITMSGETFPVMASSHSLAWWACWPSRSVSDAAGETPKFIDFRHQTAWRKATVGGGASSQVSTNDGFKHP